MKKHLLILAFLAGSTASTQAQSNVIKLNTISLLRQTGSVFFEHKVSENYSLNTGFLLVNYTSSFSDIKTEYSGFALTGEWRGYSGKENALRGFFIGPYLRYQNYHLTETLETPGTSPRVDKARLATFGGGVVLGWQKIFANSVTIEPFLGFGYAFGKVENLDNNGRDVEVGGGFPFELRPGFNIGYAFGRKAE